jgi:ABC-type multidrug transport system fused ATPase/permease subunit
MGFRMCSLRISAAIRLEYLKCLFGQPVSTLDVLPPGQTAAIITITASVLQMGISEKLSALFQSVSTVVSAFIIAMCYSWSLALVTSSGLLLIIIVYAVTTPFLVKLLNEVQHADIQASTAANEIFGSVRMVTACGAEHKIAKRYAKWVDESRRRGLKMAPFVAMQQAPGEWKTRKTARRRQRSLTFPQCNSLSTREFPIGPLGIRPRAWNLGRPVRSELTGVSGRSLSPFGIPSRCTSRSASTVQRR